MPPVNVPIKEKTLFEEFLECWTMCNISVGTEPIQVLCEVIEERLNKITEIKYKKHEFCKYVECPFLENLECNRKKRCIESARCFHHWLKQNDFKIIKSSAG